MSKKKLVITLLCTIFASGCSLKQDSYILAREEQETSGKRFSEAERVVADMQRRLSTQIDAEGTQPASAKTKALKDLTTTVAEIKGLAQKPVKDLTETAKPLANLKECSRRDKVAKANIEYQANLQHGNVDKLQISNNELTKKLGEVERNYNKIRPFVYYFWFFVLIAIGVSGSAMVFYHGIVTRTIQKIRGTLLATSYGISTAVVGILWYLYGQSMIMYGILAAGILFVVFAISYAVQRERFVRLVTAIEQGVREQLGSVDKEKMNKMLNEHKLTPSKAIAYVKASLGL